MMEKIMQPEVKAWLHMVYERMVAVFARSNFYDQVHLLYDELGTFGTGAMLVEEDDEATLRCRTLTAGEYCLDVNASGRVDTLYRRLRMTPRQIVEAWPDTSPDRVKDLDRRGNGQWLEVLHVVEPNPDYREGDEAAVRPWRSVYLMTDSDDVLEESGYYEFPALCPRWNTTGSDIYGESPAMDALGDCRLLQKLEEDGLIALEKEVNPPLSVAKSDGLGRVINASPGAINYVSPLAQGQNAIQPLYQVRANLGLLEQVKEQKRQNIRESFYNDLFLMVSQVNRQMTATEVAERNSEKMLLLGPVLDRLRSELFQPLIVRVFGIMTRQGMVPPPPDALQGREIKIEFISILAQAQKQAGIAAINNTVAFVGNVAQFSPTALDKLNIDEAIDEVAEMNGVPPSLIRSNEEVAELRAQREEQMQQQQMMAAMQSGADVAATGARAAKDLGLSEAMAGMGGESVAALQ
ncbi:phage tail protein [Deltaproteobacteria bacterium Smac51]|nr:phage tail protein [Deltaproteobacteria bacterium Smac51]